QGMAPRMIRPAWNGMMLPGKRLLLVADQGFGGAFHFSRYVPLAAARCAGVGVFLGGAAGGGLSARLDGARACVTDMAKVGEHAAFAWLGSLQRVFGNVPAMVPYLSPEPARRSAWRARRFAWRDRSHAPASWAGPEGRPRVVRQSGEYRRLAAFGGAGQVARVGRSGRGACGGCRSRGDDGTGN